MVEVAVILTVGTVLILLALTLAAIWIVPKSLAFEDHDDHDEESTTNEPRKPPA